MTPNDLRALIVLAKRATLTGEEAPNVAKALAAAEALYVQISTPGAKNGNDANAG